MESARPISNPSRCEFNVTYPHQKRKSSLCASLVTQLWTTTYNEDLLIKTCRFTEKKIFAQTPNKIRKHWMNWGAPIASSFSAKFLSLRHSFFSLTVFKTKHWRGSSSFAILRRQEKHESLPSVSPFLPCPALISASLRPYFVPHKYQIRRIWSAALISTRSLFASLPVNCSLIYSSRFDYTNQNIHQWADSR